jgi:hypothetical protein
MKVKITLVKFKSECPVYRFFSLAATHLYGSTRKVFE